MFFEKTNVIFGYIRSMNSKYAIACVVILVIAIMALVWLCMSGIPELMCCEGMTGIRERMTDKDKVGRYNPFVHGPASGLAWHGALSPWTGPGWVGGWGGRFRRQPYGGWSYHLADPWWRYSVYSPRRNPYQYWAAHNDPKTMCYDSCNSEESDAKKEACLLNCQYYYYH